MDKVVLRGHRWWSSGIFSFSVMIYKMIDLDSHADSNDFVLTQIKYTQYLIRLKVTKMISIITSPSWQLSFQLEQCVSGTFRSRFLKCVPRYVTGEPKKKHSGTCKGSDSQERWEMAFIYSKDVFIYVTRIEESWVILFLYFLHSQWWLVCWIQLFISYFMNDSEWVK